MSESQPQPSWIEKFLPDWVRARKANLKGVKVSKLTKANKERGIEIEIDGDKLDSDGTLVTYVKKVIVKGNTDN